MTKTSTNQHELCGASRVMFAGSVARASARPRSDWSSHAFTRIELTALVTALGLLGTVVLPSFASTQSRAKSAQCLNNLRLMGRAVQIWGSEYSGMPPWRTSVSDGGTRPDSGVKPGVAWYEYSFMSNELVTPRILACPADDGVEITHDFISYKSAGYREDATSYSLNLHAASENSAGVVFSDRNLRFDAYGGVGCSMRITVAGTIVSTFASAGWTNSIHGSFGNIVVMDGSVLETTSAEFRAAIRSSDENGSVHFLKGR